MDDDDVVGVIVDNSEAVGGADDGVVGAAVYVTPSQLNSCVK